MTADARPCFNFPEKWYTPSFTIGLVQDCAVISATAELLSLIIFAWTYATFLSKRSKTWEKTFKTHFHLKNRIHEQRQLRFQLEAAPDVAPNSTIRNRIKLQYNRAMSYWWFNHFSAQSWGRYCMALLLELRGVTYINSERR